MAICTMKPNNVHNFLFPFAKEYMYARNFVEVYFSRNNQSNDAPTINTDTVHMKLSNYLSSS